MDGDISAEDRITPILAIIQWMGYARARVFRTSADLQEIIGVCERGGELNVTSFRDLRFPTSFTLVPKAVDEPKFNGAVSQGPGHFPELFGKEHCQQFIELILRYDNRIVGTMVVDDVKHRNRGSDRVYGDDDIARIRPLADYVSRVLGIQIKFEHDRAIECHAEKLRQFDAAIQSFIQEHVLGEPNSTILLREHLSDQLSLLLRAEIDVLGYHLRFCNKPGMLESNSGRGIFYEYLPREDPTSLATRCFEQGQKELIQAKDDPLVGELRKRVTEWEQCGKISVEQRTDILNWCKEMRVTGGFPILSGALKLGTLEVHARVGDYFQTESLKYLEDICSSIARFMAPARQRADHLALLGKYCICLPSASL